ncbi:hypothetical protein KAU51_03700 [Candidatus Parcubacteria bacterium]|nr:hypothetical protein [Candidatus Parcubacteria bacterium]
MWISSKKYDTLWEEKYQLQKDKALLIRILSGVVLSQGGKVIIPMPSTDSRTLHWKGAEDGTVTIKSKVFDLENGEFETK